MHIEFNMFFSNISATWKEYFREEEPFKHKYKVKFISQNIFLSEKTQYIHVFHIYLKAFIAKPQFSEFSVNRWT